MKTMRDVEKLCSDYRKGKISDDSFRLQFVAFMATCSKANLTITAERQQFGLEGGDGS